MQARRAQGWPHGLHRVSARTRSPDKLTAHPGGIVLALAFGHLTGCGQPWVSGCSPDAAAPCPGYLLNKSVTIDSAFLLSC